MVFLIILVLILFIGLIGALHHKQKWVNWGGAYDDETCEGCRKAFEGNPYPIEKAPQPGSFECGDKCRHALQLTNPPKKK